ncbi:hypothetical protein SKA58_19555 [Sphingomonas sp. SKA58]|uniref:hypothetical protein n=1 Tax=Sphingomonas sp. (strain SKA58) TaxID=314266 RepID=UPI0000D7B1A4|nr:hypothetical protein [Sphingomonas sp. SKA58]EAT07460.1 hypothetical protein SKA58_19555 [Sphingomonas sp. SKA58]
MTIMRFTGYLRRNAARLQIWHDEIGPYNLITEDFGGRLEAMIGKRILVDGEQVDPVTIRAHYLGLVSEAASAR